MYFVKVYLNINFFASSETGIKRILFLSFISTLKILQFQMEIINTPTLKAFVLMNQIIRRLCCTQFVLKQVTFHVKKDAKIVSNVNNVR